MFRTITELIVLGLIAIFLTTHTIAPTARAAAIDTSTYLGISDTASHNELQAILTRADVRHQLISYGVDPDAAAARIASLSHEELAEIQRNIDNLPAGSSALAILGAVLLVLIILEVLGVTNVFTKL